MRGVAALVVILGALAAAAPAGAITPNDPTWYAAWGQRLVHMPQVWDITTGSPNVIIATVDTGVDPAEPDLQGNLVPGWDFTAGDNGMRDIYGHGTAVASVIAARGNNGYGIAGYCWQCRVMPVRVSVNGSVTSPQLAAGIRWAADQPGVRIINIGFNDEGTGWYDTRLAQAMRYAQARGILVFASAGNSSSDGVTYPAGYGGAYPVAATDQTDALYPWTTRGAWVPFAAPGCTPVIWVVGVFSEVCGTSVTAPALSGIAGLLLSAKPGLSADQVLVALHAGMVPVSGIGGGRVDALAAFHAIGLDPPPTPPGQPTPPPPPADGKILPSTNEADLETGTLRRRRSYKLALGDGPLTIALTTRKARTCTLTLASADGGQVTVASTTGRYKVRLRENVPAGRYRLTIRCTSARPRPFQLLITSSSVAIG